jgi:glutamate synthase domain-containing protein 1
MCGIAGFIHRDGKKVDGKDIIKMSCVMEPRYDGRGGGFAAYGIYPEHREQYALHLIFKDEEAKKTTEEYLKQKVNIVKEEEIPTKKIQEIPKEYITWRYFIDVPEKAVVHENISEEDYVVKTVMHINENIGGAFVLSSGKNMGIFKATGMPRHVAELFRIKDYKAYMWIVHGRFPTNTRGWWGGAHPFNILDWSVVHNGEISSYGTNRRYLEMHGYKCTLFTDTEVVAYLFDLIVRKQGLKEEVASIALTPPFWKHIESMNGSEREAYRAIRMTYAPAMLNGPFGIIVANRRTLIGLNDRIKLRPLIAAEADGGNLVYVASEEAAIREVKPELDRVWAPKAGSPTIARLHDDVEV